MPDLTSNGRLTWDATHHISHHQTQPRRYDWDIKTLDQAASIKYYPSFQGENYAIQWRCLSWGKYAYQLKYLSAKLEYIHSRVL